MLLSIKICCTSLHPSDSARANVLCVFYSAAMTKTITDNQLIGELGEATTRAQFLRMGFQFDVRSRLEAGIDAIAEVMLDGQPTAKMIAVQVKSTRTGKYTSETDGGFTYLLKLDDLNYWRGSNLPVIIVLYREWDDSFYWKDVGTGIDMGERRLVFDKAQDRLDRSALDRLAALTVPKQGHGYYVPPLGGGESAIVNILPVSFPDELFVATTPYSPRRAAAILHDADSGKRFDWTIHESTFWAFYDPRDEATRDIIDADQVEAIETSLIADHEDINVQNQFAHLLRLNLAHQFGNDLGWDKERKLFFFRPLAAGLARTLPYMSTKKKTSAQVVSVYTKKDGDGISYVRHHAFKPRFERLGEQWYLIVSPTYFFTSDGYSPHSHPHALLAGKKRADNNASLRGQVIMWHRFLSHHAAVGNQDSLFSGDADAAVLGFGGPPSVELSTSVPESAWRITKVADADDEQGRFDLHAV